MIILAHGYFLEEDEKEKAIMKPYAPLGILYLSAYLEQKNIQHEVFDTTFSTKHIFQQFLLDKKPTILAFYVNLMTKVNVLQLVQFVKSTPLLSHTKIVVGGPDVRYNKENLITAGADFLVVGEGEETFLELVTALQQQTNFDAIPGLAFKDENRNIIVNPDRSLRKDIDELPFPNRKKIDLQQYLQVWKKHHGSSSVTISTMRGCPYTCNWCSRAVYGKSYRRRKPENVIQEIKEIIANYNPDNIWFVDDVFTVSHKWLQEFTELIVQEKLPVKYECITRADRLNDEVISLLQQSGCFRMWIGAESGSQRIIDLMDRRVDVAVVQQMIGLARQKNIQAGTFIMLGYPTETEDDIKQTLQHLKKSNPNWFTITITYPIKGTELFTQVHAISNADKLNWKKTTDRDIDFNRSYSHKYYQYAMQWIVNEMNFYQRRQKQLTFIAAIASKLKALKARLGMMLEKSKPQLISS